MSMRSLLNPFRYGFFSFELLSHKVLRWMVPAMMIVLLFTNVALAVYQPIYRITLGLQLLFYGLAIVGKLRRNQGDLPMILYIPYYFCLVNSASARGIFEAYRGKTYATWSTARADN